MMDRDSFKEALIAIGMAAVCFVITTLTEFD